MKSYFIYIFILALFITRSGHTQAGQVIHMLSPEVRALHGTGGLQHAVLDKAKFIQAQGHEVKIVMPFYGTMEEMEHKDYKVVARDVEVVMNQGQARMTTDIVEFSHPENSKIKIVAVKHKPGMGYDNLFNNITSDGSKTYTLHANEGEVFSYYAKAYTQWIDTLEKAAQPDVVVLNDWHTGITSAYLRERKDKYLSNMNHTKKIPVVQGVIHNLKYQGVYGHDLFQWLALDQKYFNALDMHGNINFLKTMMELSDYVETVSMNYAKEITNSRFAEGLESITARLAKEGRLSGLINGIDTEVWDPKKPNIMALDDPKILDKEFKDLGFSKDNMENKKLGKQKLLQRFFSSASDSKSMVVALTARLDNQKGFSFLTGAGGVLEEILGRDDLDIKFVIAGDPHGVRHESPIVQELEKLQQKYPNKISINKFHPQLERMFLYFSDFYLGASTFEPSGLAQMFSQSVGTVPVLSSVGGHVDSVVDGKTGLLFDLAYEGDKLQRQQTVNNVVKALEKAHTIYHDEQKFNQLRLNAISLNNSWSERINYFEKFLDLASIEFFAKVKAKRKGNRGPIDLTKYHGRLAVQGAFCFRAYQPHLGL